MCLPGQVNFVLACQTTARPPRWRLSYSCCSNRRCFLARVSPNRLGIHEIMLSFVFIRQVKPPSCWRVKPLFACLRLPQKVAVNLK
jgi:hypothetical protein